MAAICGPASDVLSCSLSRFEHAKSGSDFDCIKVHDSFANTSLTISLHRTVRVPDSLHVSPLPPSFGTFPLYPVAKYADKLPIEIVKKGPGCLFPIHQREAMWLDFTATGVFQVRIYSGGVNVITGKSRKNEEETAETNIREKRPVEQDYMVVGPKKQCSATQLWLDGFVLADGTIRQFVAVAPRSGHSVESQLTGVEEVGGIQIEVAPRFLPKGTFEMFIKTLTGRSIPLSFDTDSPSNISIHEIKARIALIEGIPMEKQRLIYGGKQLENHYYLDDYNIPTDSGIHLVLKLSGGGDNTTTVESQGKGIPVRPKPKVELALGAGGKILQTIRSDPGFKFRDQETIFWNVQLLSASSFPRLLGIPAPESPIDVKAYAQAGVPYFKIWNEKVSGASPTALDQVCSIGLIDTARNDGDATMEMLADPIEPQPLILIDDNGDPMDGVLNHEGMSEDQGYDEDDEDEEDEEDDDNDEYDEDEDHVCSFGNC